MPCATETLEVYTIAGCTMSAQRCAADYAPLVKRIAHHLMARLPASVQIDDLQQAGMMGLIDALARYNDHLDIQFEVFASHRIRGAMLDELRANDWLPRPVRRALRDIEAAIHILEQRLGRPPQEGEIAAQLKVSLAEYQALLQSAKGHQLIGISDFEEDEESAYLKHHAVDADTTPLRHLHDENFRLALIKAIEHLPEREAFMMSMYYEQELNLREIAAVFEVSESRVCQIHTQAVARIRAQLKDWL